MHVVQSCCPNKDGLGRYRLNGVGLGASEWAGQSKTGGVINTVLSMNPNLMLTKIPGVDKFTKMMGIQLTPITIALAPFTMGLSLVPGINKVINSLFGGFFKEATHMESCMKYWTDENIGAMIASTPLLEFNFHTYMMKEFPQFLRQYQIMQADGRWQQVGIDQLISSGNRRAKMRSMFIGVVRSNPDLMMAECAVHPEGVKQLGVTIPPRIVSKAWADIKEVIQFNEAVSLIAEVDRRLEPYKVKEQWREIVASRNKQLVTTKADGGSLKVGDSDVVGIKRGAFVMTTKSAQSVKRG